jgi:type IV secretory pathway VirD2 relaxase
VCEEPRCDSPMFSRAGVQAPDAYTRPHDGEIKEAHPEGAKPLTCLAPSRDGEKAHMFSATEDRCDAAAFARRSRDDRHHFRFIVAPEDAAEMTDLKAFTRDLVTQMERDLGTRLDWVAVDYWNTEIPHLLVRGITEDGSDLVISRDYISHGLRSRAEELVSVELGPKPEVRLASVER